LGVLAGSTRPEVAAAECLLTALFGYGVLVYAWFRYFRPTASREDGIICIQGQLSEFLLILAAFLLIVPGMLMDVFGLILLAPAVRRSAATLLDAHLRGRSGFRGPPVHDD
jgi:UPF0716 family protein affecting phage T7 exclusion